MNKVDHIYHFTKSIDTVMSIFDTGFKPSYCIEKLAEKNMLVPMVPFSNILLYHYGEDQVLFYGNYAIGFKRDWAIINDLNPVAYTFENGMLYNAINDLILSTAIFNSLPEFKDYYKSIHEKGTDIGQTLKLIPQIGTKSFPKEVMPILSYICKNYNEELVELIYEFSKKIYDTNWSILKLTKPYKVITKDNIEFIAYNDREWRKLYSDLDIILQNDANYNDWTIKDKPHFNEQKYLLKFDITDVKCILVEKKEQIIDFLDYLNRKFENKLIDSLLANKELIIGTKNTLIENGF